MGSGNDLRTPFRKRRTRLCGGKYPRLPDFVRAPSAGRGLPAARAAYHRAAPRVAPSFSSPAATPQRIPWTLQRSSLIDQFTASGTSLTPPTSYDGRSGKSPDAGAPPPPPSTARLPPACLTSSPSADISSPRAEQCRPSPRPPHVHGPLLYPAACLTKRPPGESCTHREIVNFNDTRSRWELLLGDGGRS